jgi:ATP-dependent Lhr-like helicase
VEVETALASLASEGVAMSGLFTPGAAETEWCERGLLARIHRYTVKRLREEIEPVTTQDFMRFLLRWQHVVPAERRQGRTRSTRSSVRCRDSKRRRPRGSPRCCRATDRLRLHVARRPVPVGTDRLATVDRAERDGHAQRRPDSHVANRAAAAANLTVVESSRQCVGRGGRDAERARAARADHLQQSGASFFDEIVEGVAMLRTEVEEALAELVANGVATSDSFAGLRALLTPSQKRKPFGNRRGRSALFGIEDAGRWALYKRPQATADGVSRHRDADTAAVEHVVHTLLRRYGVVFWRLLQREAPWLPPWRELLHVLRRLEARGDIRGGRFVAGVSGEQFALPDAVRALRETRRAEARGELIAVSGADPLNLVGVLLPGTKVPALAGNRIVYRDGLAVAALVSGEMRWLERLEPVQAAAAEEMLVRRRGGSPLLAYLR